MSNIDILEVKAGIEEENEGYARQVRAFLSDNDVAFINVMASPGAGKTTLLCRLIDILKADFCVGIIEADVDSDVDARTVAEHGAKVVQLHTGGSCHMDARMTLQGLKALVPQMEGRKLVFLENIGNLVCPAEFDTGADTKLVILSTPEGDDKPLKYPLMFTVADVLVISKTELADVFSFSPERFEKNVRPLNKDAQILPLSARNGQGVDALANWIRERVAAK